MTGPRVAMLTLVALSAAAPAAQNIILPALPAIQHDFDADLGTTQLIISLSLAGVAAAMLIYGPLADRFGRRPVILAGMALFLVGSLICVVAPDMATLIAGRIIQAAGAAAGIVLARAIVRDVYGEAGTARAMAYLTMALAVAPMVAPLVGGAIVEHWSWREVFMLLSALGALLLVDLFLRLPETHRERTAMPGFAGLVGGFGRLLRLPSFCGYAFHQSFSLAVFYVFAATAPHFMLTVQERPATEFGLYFMVLAGAFIVASFTSARIVGRYGIDRLIVLGTLVGIAASAAGLLLVLKGFWGPLAIYGPAIVVGFSNGLTMPNSQAGAVNADPKAAGAASGLVGCLQMVGAGIATQAVGLFDVATPVPMASAMFLLAVASLAVFALAQRAGRRRLARAHRDGA